MKTPAAFVHSSGRVVERDVELRPMPMDPASVADREAIVRRANQKDSNHGR